jgi:hypothetical protein
MKGMIEYEARIDYKDDYAVLSTIVLISIGYIPHPSPHNTYQQKNLSSPT